MDAEGATTIDEAESDDVQAGGTPARPTEGAATDTETRASRPPRTTEPAAVRFRLTRLSRTLLLYAAKGILVNAAVAFVAIEAVQGTIFTLRATEDFQLDLVVLLPVLLTSFGQALVYALPIALLLGTGLFVGRLNADRELLALQSFGLSPAQLLAPVAVLGIVFSLLASYLNHSWVPQFRFANRNIQALILDKISYLGEGWNMDFNVEGQSVWIYHHDGPLLEGILVGVDKADASGDGLVGTDTLEKIDSSLTYPFYVFAERGYITRQEDGGSLQVELRGVNVFFDGDLLDDGEASDFQETVHFETLTWSPPISKKSEGIKDRTTRSLLGEIERRKNAARQVEGNPNAERDVVKGVRKSRDKAIAVLQRRIAISLCALTFPLAAFAMGLTIRSSNRLAPFFWASSIVPAVYFSLELFGKKMAENGTLPYVVPHLGNVGLLLLCAGFVVVARRR